MTKRLDPQDICQGGWRHKWADEPIDLEYRPDRYYEFWVAKVCERCGKVAVDVFDPAGEKAYTYYIDPPDWKKHNRPDRLAVAKAMGAKRQKPTETKKPSQRKRSKRAVHIVVPLNSRRRRAG